jgi:hypothetical protein
MVVADQLLKNRLWDKSPKMVTAQNRKIKKALIVKVHHKERRDLKEMVTALAQASHNKLVALKLQTNHYLVVH